MYHNSFCFAVQIFHDSVLYPRPCKACEMKVDSAEDMVEHLSTTEHKETVKKLGYFSKTNPCEHCNLEFAV